MDRALHRGAQKQEVISVTLVNNVTKIIDTTVPSGKRWVVLAVKMINADDVARACIMRLFKEAGKTNLLEQLQSISKNAGVAAYWPTLATSGGIGTRGDHLIVLAPGNVIECTWSGGGASSGGTDADGLVIQVLEFPA